MTGVDTPRGSAPVGHLEELDPIGTASVCYLRLWSEGPVARASLCEDVFPGIGKAHGDHALATFEELCSLLGRFGRRPLMRHSAGCRCLGSDEACFALLVATAADGDREEATLIATLLVRADVSPMVAAAASKFGLALKRMRLLSARAFTQPTAAPPPREMIH